MKLRSQTTNKIVTVLKDLVLSMLAYALPAISLTFVIQPYMASCVDGDTYGDFLLQLSVIRLISLVLVGPLSNLRLLLDKKYKEQQLSGDFSLLLIVGLLMAPIILVLVLLFYETQSVYDYILGIVALLLIMLHDYYSVFFRVVIQYSKLIVDNILIVIGYVVGLIVYTYYPCWQFVVIAGYLFGFVYLLFTSPYWKEKPNKTALFSSTRRQYAQLSFSHLIRESIHYCDKLVVYPILGSESVAVYNAAAIVGKALYLVTTPLCNVILSYIPRLKDFDGKLLRRLLLLGTPVFGVAYGALYGLGRIILPILYPQFTEDAIPVLWCVVLAILLGSCAALLNPLLLRFDKMSSQITISAIKLGLYLATAIILSKYFNLLGFSFGYLISSAFHFGLILFRLMRIAVKTDQEKKAAAFSCDPESND